MGASSVHAFIAVSRGRTCAGDDPESASFRAGHAFDGAGFQQFARNLRAHRVVLALRADPMVWLSGRLAPASHANQGKARRGSQVSVRLDGGRLRKLARKQNSADEEVKRSEYGVASNILDVLPVIEPAQEVRNACNH